MKRILLSIFVLSLVATVNAQDGMNNAENVSKKIAGAGELKDGWNKGGQFSALFTQASHNSWYTNPDQILSIVGNIDYKANMKKGKNRWYNAFLASYGTLNNVTQGVGFRKNVDNLLLSSLYARQINNKWGIGGSLDLQTQFTPTYSYTGITKGLKLSNFLTPGSIMLGVGAIYTPNKKLRVYISPLTANITTKMDKDFLKVNRDGVDSGKTINFGLGALARINYDDVFFKKLKYSGRLDLFTDYLDNPFTHTDVFMYNSFGINIAKYFGVNLMYNLRYRDAEKMPAPNDWQYRGLQTLQTLGIGFNYTLK